MNTFNFKVDEGRKPTDDDKLEKDVRNGIVCYNPTYDIPCYVNYLNLLNDYRDRWRNFGYLDLGMMPLDMAPSFMQGAVSEAMSQIANLFRIPIYKMPAVSLMYDKPMLVGDDIWAFKADVAKVMGKTEHEVTLSNFLRWCNDDVIGTK